jgi:acetyl esterase/lipase
MVFVGVGVVLAWGWGVGAQNNPSPTAGAGRQLPARFIPAPQTVSPLLRKQAALPFDQLPKIGELSPKSDAEWREAADARARMRAGAVADVKQNFPTNIEARTIAGVKTFVITPASLASANRDRLLLCFHGGAYVFLGGESGLNEPILMAHYCQTKVIAVDYRMPPDYPFPAAIDDIVAVWKEMTKTYKPANIGMGGTSAGGALSLAAVIKLKELKLPLPGAIFGGTTWADLTHRGDSIQTNAYLDDVLPTHKGMLDSAAGIYAGKEDRRNPLISPLYATDFAGFPPTILVTGTRDLLLSDTVRVHRKLRHAGVDAQLHVFEGMSHAGYLILSASPESKDAWGEVAKFFDGHLGR